MNSKERDLLETTRKIGSISKAGELLGFTAGSIAYYAHKWQSKGWFDGAELTSEAPPAEKTLRQTLLESALFDKL